MEKLIVQGGQTFSGPISVSGSKNTALPLMAGAMLPRGKTTINNVPEGFPHLVSDDLQDPSTLAVAISASVSLDHALFVFGTTIFDPEKEWQVLHWPTAWSS